MDVWESHFTHSDNEVFWVRDLKLQKMIYVSDAYEIIWGDSLKNIYNDASRFVKFIHPDDVDRVKSSMLNSQTLGGFSDEYRIVRPDGEIRWIYARSFPVLNAEGEVYRIAGKAEDITERKMNEQKRLLFEREQKETLVREVHHRIKNNLQGIIGLLRQQLGSYSELEDVLCRVISQVQSIAMIHGLQGQSQLVYLCEIVQAIGLAITNLYAHRSKIDIRIESDKPVLLGEEDAVPIALIINELLTNAVKHGLKNSAEPVRLELHSDGCNAEIKVWNRFANNTVNQPNANPGKGSGLGLIKSLMPYKGARLVFDKRNGNFEVELKLESPVTQPKVSGMREPSLD